MRTEPDRNRTPMEGYRHKCPNCGKGFWAFSDWAYRLRLYGRPDRDYFCSWKCLREAEKRSDIEKEERKKKCTSRIGKAR